MYIFTYIYICMYIYIYIYIYTVDIAMTLKKNWQALRKLFGWPLRLNLSGVGTQYYYITETGLNDNDFKILCMHTVVFNKISHLCSSHLQKKTRQF